MIDRCSSKNKKEGSTEYDGKVILYGQPFERI